MKTSSFLGLRTVVYYVPDMKRARDWYATLLGIEPYFDQPFYIGFNVGGFELGLHPTGDTPAPGPGGSTTYWGVDDMTASWRRMVGLGAAPVKEPEDVGDGIKVATLADPFGNHIGIIENPQFPNTA